MRLRFLGILTMWLWCGMIACGAAYFLLPGAPKAVSVVTITQCHWDPHYADRSCTPGSTFPHVTRADVCTRGWATAHRHTTDAQRHRVFAAYGIPYAEHSIYEFDHLIPLEAGGSNADTNVWPERIDLAQIKDKIENTVHKKICRGERTVSQIRTFIHRKYTRRF